MGIFLFQVIESQSYIYYLECNAIIKRNASNNCIGEILLVLPHLANNCQVYKKKYHSNRNKNKNIALLRYIIWYPIVRT